MVRFLILATAALLLACGEAPPPAAAAFRPSNPGPLSASLRAARERALVEEITRIGVPEGPVWEALRSTDRRVFLPAEMWPDTWADRALRRPDGATLTAPDLTAAMLHALDLGPEDRVLECGTRTGWLTALLARLAGEVSTISSQPAGLAGARRCLEVLGIENVRFGEADPLVGWPEDGPFDAIVVNGRVDHVPRALYRALKPGGRILFVPVGCDGEDQTLLLITRGEGEPASTRALLSVRFGGLR